MYALKYNNAKPNFLICCVLHICYISTPLNAVLNLHHLPKTTKTMCNCQRVSFVVRVSFNSIATAVRCTAVPNVTMVAQPFCCSRYIFPSFPVATIQLQQLLNLQISNLLSS